MRKSFLKIINFPWYFVAFAAYPVLALLSSNLDVFGYTVVFRPLVISIYIAVILFLILTLIYRNWHKAAFAISALTILFYTYGYVIDQVSEKWDTPHLAAWMLGLWLALVILVLILAALRKVKFIKAAFALNLISLCMVIIVVFQIVSGSVLPPTKGPAAEFAPTQPMHVQEGQTPPDIYYIILDSYARADLLEQTYHYDNSEFIRLLEGMGFYVAGCSQSNYGRTDISIASSLNMDYLQNLDSSFNPENINRDTLWASILHSAVRANLESAGYKTVAFATGYSWTEMKDADVFLSPSPLWSGITEFETWLIHTTPLRHLEGTSLLDLDQIDGEHYRERTQLILDSMVELAHMPDPKFVFIHIVPPHPPFIFGPDGSWTNPADFLDENLEYSPEDYSRGILNEVKFINTQIIKALATLLLQSSHPPVIILQGDHAPWFHSNSDEKKILNAYYLPGHTDLLYPTISPVNSFRLVLNTYLGADFSLLDDRSYNSNIPDIYTFDEVMNPCAPTPSR